MVQGLGLKVYGSGFRVKGLWFRVQTLGKPQAGAEIDVKITISGLCLSGHPGFVVLILQLKSTGGDEQETAGCARREKVKVCL